jgi:putative ABC transport system permease protein
MRWSRLFRRARWDAERAREVETYLEFETEDNLARGMAPEHAREAARRKLGNPTLICEEIYRMNTISFIETLGQDFRYACRVLRKSPGFTAVAILSLALGVGANTAVFTVVNAVLLRALPYAQPEQLVYVGRQNTLGAITIPEYEFWKEHSAAFSSVAGQRGTGQRRLVSSASSEWISAMTVTADFLRTLGTPPALGREFNSEETRNTGPRAIVLSDSLWRRSFQADPGVIGRTVALDEIGYTVVGVLPRGFWFSQSFDALVPLRPNGGVGDTGFNTLMLARLKPGISLRQAQAEMATVTQDYIRAYPGNVGREYRGLSPIPYQEWIAGDVRMKLLLLFGAVGLLLLIACSNLVSLLLTRLTARWKEIAVRLALGTTRGRLLRQFLMENFLLAALGSIAGLCGAYWLLGSLVALIPFSLPASGPIRLNLPVLVFTLAAALFTGLVFTLVPFLASSRLNLHEALKAGGRSAGAGMARRGTRNALVVAEVALSATLLIAAGLLIQSLYRLRQERLGFQAQGLVTLETPIDREHRRNTAGLSRYVDTLLENLQRTPGVRTVAGINVLPLTGQSNLPAQRDAHPENSIGGTEIRLITPAYFEAMNIPVRAGRASTDGDAAGSPPVALVNETLARRWWPEGGALNDRVVIGRFRDRDFPEIRDVPRQVVGVVADTKTANLKEPTRPTIFVPIAQAQEAVAQGSGSIVWILRTAASGSIAAEVRRAVTEADPRQRVRRLQSMEEIVSSTTADSRFDAWLFGAFAAVALALAAVGVYGLLSFSVAQRRQEIGTRMALGAGRWDILKLVLREGLALTAIGLVLGIGGALFVTRFLSTLLFGVRPNDPVSFVAVAVLLLAVGAIASYVPARRATRIDPMTALRYD